MDLHPMIRSFCKTKLSFSAGIPTERSTLRARPALKLLPAARPEIWMMGCRGFRLSARSAFNPVVVMLRGLMFKVISIFFAAGIILIGCASTAEKGLPHTSGMTAPITQAEAKSEACPKSLLEAGASEKDCICVETELFKLGQVPGALSPEGQSPSAIFGGDAGRRKIAIGLLRHDAAQACGLFAPDHIVSKNL